MEVSMNLVNLATDVYQQAVDEDDEDGEGDEEDLNTIDVEAALKSAQYKKYINAVAEIEKIKIEDLPEHQRKAVILNIYQCMYIHNFLRKVFEEGANAEEGNNNGLIGSLK